jgi:hypothetical protein
MTYQCVITTTEDLDDIPVVLSPLQKTLMTYQCVITTIDDLDGIPIKHVNYFSLIIIKYIHTKQ